MDPNGRCRALHAAGGGRMSNSSRPKVYIETSVLSYLVGRSSRDPVIAARQAITRLWWDNERHKYTLTVSEAVRAECAAGNPEMARRRLTHVNEASLFHIDETILRLARLLIVPGAIPETADVDAVHIAAAAIEECEYLLTWNFRHIANVQIRREVERILANHGFKKTTICTPEELFRA